MYTEEVIDGFSKAAESLKKYRRAELLDEAGKSILDDMYVDLLRGDVVLKKCLLDNTTFLIGRKGTGKSTIFLILENEYRKKATYLHQSNVVYGKKITKQDIENAAEKYYDEKIDAFFRASTYCLLPLEGKKGYCTT